MLINVRPTSGNASTEVVVSIAASYRCHLRPATFLSDLRGKTGSTRSLFRMLHAQAPHYVPQSAWCKRSVVIKIREHFPESVIPGAKPTSPVSSSSNALTAYESTAIEGTLLKTGLPTRQVCPYTVMLPLHEVPKRPDRFIKIDNPQDNSTRRLATSSALTSIDKCTCSAVPFTNKLLVSG